MQGRQRPLILRFLLAIWPYALMVGGLFLVGRPVVLDMWEAKQAQDSISEIESTYDSMGDVAVQTLWDEAVIYNDRLLAHESVDDLNPYAMLLSFPRPDMIAHLVIPKLSLDLPIYHGTDENTLMVGVGHVEGTQLPVGTAGGRCVLAGHSGMPNARMFDDIHLLEEGDRFVVWTLGRPLAYEVIESKVVLPEDSDEILPPEDDSDLVTLVTCTPYGVNTHRLLVTGKRCEYVEHEEEMPAPEAYVNRRTIPLIAGCVIIVVTSVAGIVGGVARRRRNRSGSSEQTGGSVANRDA